MTATIPASRPLTVAVACPSWCDEHIGDLHQRWLSSTNGQLQVVLERQDHNGQPGRPQLSFRFCADGELIDESAELPVDAIFEVLRLSRT